MSAIKRSISAQAELFAQADKRQQELGYSTFSDYIQALMRADAMSSAGHLREPTPAPYGKPAPAPSSERLAAARKKVVDIVRKSAQQKAAHSHPKSQ